MLHPGKSWVIQVADVRTKIHSFRKCIIVFLSGEGGDKEYRGNIPYSSWCATDLLAPSYIFLHTCKHSVIDDENDNFLPFFEFTLDKTFEFDTEFCLNFQKV